MTPAQPILEMQMQPRAEADVAPTMDAGEALVERLARDPNVGVDVLERVMAMRERMQANRAKQEFYADFARMQGDLPTVQEKGKTNNGKYARHEDIIEAVRPVLQKFGFILTFRVTFPDGGVRVVGVLAHRSGHSEETEFISKPDVSGSKNAIQALGSAQSYGQRYTTRALLNIASSDADDDGKATGKPKAGDAPAGFDDWWTDFSAVADEGQTALERAWSEASKSERTKAFLLYASETRGKELNDLKKKAARVAAQ